MAYAGSLTELTRKCLHLMSDLARLLHTWLISKSQMLSCLQHENSSLKLETKYHFASEKRKKTNIYVKI